MGWEFGLVLFVVQLDIMKKKGIEIKCTQRKINNCALSPLFVDCIFATKVELRQKFIQVLGTLPSQRFAKLLIL